MAYSIQIGGQDTLLDTGPNVDDVGRVTGDVAPDGMILPTVADLC